MKVDHRGVSLPLTSQKTKTMNKQTMTTETPVLSGDQHDYREATNFVIISRKNRKHETTQIADEKVDWFNYKDGNIEREMSLRAYQNAQSRIFSAKGADYTMDGSPKENIKIVFI